MNALTLKARLRNAKLAHVPYYRMAPALRALDSLNDYRDARRFRADYPVFPSGDEADSAALWDEEKEIAAKAFASAREEMRRGFRAAASSRTLERLADNPMQVAL